MELFKLVGSIFVDSSKADESIGKTDKKTGTLGKTLVAAGKTAGKFALALGTAAVAGGTALLGVANSAAETADRIDKMSNKMGISKTGFQEWDYAMAQSGMDISTLETGMKTLTSKMMAANNGTNSAKQAFDALGLSVKDSNGNIKDQETMMNEAIMALAGMENGTEKARLATQLFGKAGVEMMPMLNGGAESIQDLKDRAHELGLVMSDEAVTAGVVLGDTMDDVKRSFGAVVTQIGTRVFPIIQQFLDWVLSNMPVIQNIASTVFNAISTAILYMSSTFQAVYPTLRDGLINGFNLIKAAIDICVIAFNSVTDWINANKPLVETIIIVLGSFATAFVLVTGVVGIYNKIVAVAAVVSNALGVAIAFLTSPIGIVIIAIGAVIAIVVLLVKHWDTVKKAASICWTGIKNVFGAAKSWFTNNVYTPVKTIFSNLWSGIKSIWTGVASWFYNTVIQPIVQYYTNMFSAVKTIFDGIIQFIKGVFTGNWKSAFEGLGKVAKGIFDGLANAFKAPFRAIASFWNNTVGKLSFTLPDWIPGMGGKGFSMPKIPSFATGGMITEEMLARIGESGREAILPIDQDRGALQEIANLISAKMPDNTDSSLYEKYILDELKNMRSDIIRLLSSLKVTWNDRELCRLIASHLSTSR